MRLCKRHLLAAVVAIGVFAAAVPQAVAAPSEAKLEVNENCVEPNWPCWAAPGSSRPEAKVALASGGSVAYVDRGREANIAWAGPAPTCEPSVPVAPVGPKTGWEGRCTFTTPGTYAFESSTLFKAPGFDYTKYEVIVEGPAPAPPPGAGGAGGAGVPTGAPAPGSTPPPPGQSSGGSPLAGAPAIRSSQRGGVVRGSLQLSKAGAGGRVEIDLLAGAAALARARRARQVVGRYVKASASAGRLSFAVGLDARARAALRRRHRLVVTVRITLTPLYGAAVSATSTVALHP